jgi:membrane protein implicated in regulation of membrane protease activity
MAAFLSALVFWHWFVMGGLLLLLEMLAPGAIFLWPGIAAVVMGLVTFAVPTLPWTLTVPVWAILSVVTAFGWRAYRQKNPAPVNPDASTLNQRGSQYVGRHFTLTKPIINGVGEMKVDDTIWKVISDHDLIVGATVTVTAVEGTSLRVTPQ